MFWSSVDLTGNQTDPVLLEARQEFWSSVDLTGNQTSGKMHEYDYAFWSSVDLTGNQTKAASRTALSCFGAVSI